jgi:hypothetical protein
MQKGLYFIIFLLISTGCWAQGYKFCYRTYSNQYEIKINQDSKRTAYFNLYDREGNLVKTTNGTWELQDLGLYGSATYLVYKFGGANSSMPDMKLLLIRDGYGKPQELRDSEDRTWDLCQ